MSDNRVYFFDTTLRDGQQSPGAGMGFEENIRYADYADQLHMDVLEAGFPAASADDFEIVHTISQRMADKDSPMVIAGLCQLREAQLIQTMEALLPGVRKQRARIHTYLPVDPNLMQASLGRLAHNHAHLVAEVYRLINMAVAAGFEVEFSAEGYSRMANHFDFTTDLFRAAMQAGVSVINCPDTIGGAARIEGSNYFVNHMQQHADIIAAEFPDQTVIWSAHCHNDFGLALENSINAVIQGPARQIEGCINGIGERAGNVALEQCAMYFKHFGAKEDPEHPYYTGIDVSRLSEVSDFIAANMLPRQPHSPIVGDNAARHTSGGHTNAILNDPLVYQPFDPAEVGAEISLCFGPFSGGNHAKQILEKHGYSCSDAEKAEIAQAIKTLYSNRRKGITDQELIQGYLQLKEGK